MRDLVRQVVENYKSLKLEGQEEGYVLFSGEAPDTRQRVWIKVLPRLLGSDPQIAERFRRLANAIRQLNHPNIAATQEVGDKAGLPYVVTRAIERARPLAERLNQPWAVDAVADLVMQVGQALEHAYNKGVLHGSLTPDNVLVQDNGRVTVTDLGLAGLLDLVGVHIKQAASPYRAPEQVEGGPADPRADVYSLAAIAYNLLAKRGPQVVQGQVLPPSRFNPDVPPEMDNVLLKALAPNPADRYPDVKSFLAAFGAITLAPAIKKVQPAVAEGRCPRCGAEKQTGRFCRKCGARLEKPKRPAPAEQPARPTPARSKLDEPIQITRVEVGHIEVGKGIEMHPTVIARPMSVASGDLTAQFPEPVPMPQIDAEALWSWVSDAAQISMPEPPPMPAIDWGEIAPPMPPVPSIEDWKEEGD